MTSSESQRDGLLHLTSLGFWCLLAGRGIFGLGLYHLGLGLCLPMAFFPVPVSLCLCPLIFSNRHLPSDLGTTLTQDELTQRSLH